MQAEPRQSQPPHPERTQDGPGRVHGVQHPDACRSRLLSTQDGEPAQRKREGRAEEHGLRQQHRGDRQRLRLQDRCERGPGFGSRGGHAEDERRHGPWCHDRRHRRGAEACGHPRQVSRDPAGHPCPRGGPEGEAADEQGQHQGERPRRRSQDQREDAGPHDLECDGDEAGGAGAEEDPADGVAGLGGRRGRSRGGGRGRCALARRRGAIARGRVGGDRVDATGHDEGTEGGDRVEADANQQRRANAEAGQPHESGQGGARGRANGVERVERAGADRRPQAATRADGERERGAQRGGRQGDQDQREPRARRREGRAAGLAVQDPERRGQGAQKPGQHQRIQADRRFEPRVPTQSGRGRPGGRGPIGQGRPKRQSAQERGEHRTHRGVRVAERQGELPKPGHLIQQAGRAGDEIGERKENAGRHATSCRRRYHGRFRVSCADSEALTEDTRWDRWSSGRGNRAAWSCAPD